MPSSFNMEGKKRQTTFTIPSNTARDPHAITTLNFTSLKNLTQRQPKLPTVQDTRWTTWQNYCASKTNKQTSPLQQNQLSFPIVIKCSLSQDSLGLVRVKMMSAYKRENECIHTSPTVTGVWITGGDIPKHRTTERNPH